MRSNLLLAACLLAATAAGQQPVEPKPQPAVAAILDQFEQHSIVMLGEIHGSIQFDQLLSELVKSPLFAERANDIVVEMANAIWQPTLDEYISGMDVPADKRARPQDPCPCR